MFPCTQPERKKQATYINIIIIDLMVQNKAGTSFLKKNLSSRVNLSNESKLIIHLDSQCLVSIPEFNLGIKIILGTNPISIRVLGNKVSGLLINLKSNLNVKHGTANGCNSD